MYKKVVAMIDYQNRTRNRLIDFIKNNNANRSNQIELNGISLSRGLKLPPAPTAEQAYQDVLEIIEKTHRNKRHLILENKGIFNLPPEISKLKNLTHFSLRKNFLVELPPEIGSLKKLKVLILNRNQLCSLPSEIGALENISVLDIRDNYFSNIPPEIYKLRSLTKFNASFNSIRSIHSYIGRPNKLTYLSLAGNEISSVPHQILDFENLKYLDLSGNLLTDFSHKSRYLGPYTNISDNRIPPEAIVQYINIFLSYSRRDTEKMKLVKNGLEEFGYSVWTDGALIPGTPDWEKEIEENIEGANVFVVILSPHAYKSIWVRREISFAENNSKYIIPFLCDGDFKTSTPISLVNYQTIDGRNDLKLGINNVIETIGVFVDN